jgi:hypothetical protein
MTIHTITDPIFAATKTCQHATARVGALSDPSDDELTEACEVWRTATRSLLSTAPTTVAGALALIRHALGREGTQDSVMLMEFGAGPHDEYAGTCTLLTVLADGLAPFAGAQS